MRKNYTSESSALLFDFLPVRPTVLSTEYKAVCYHGYLIWQGCFVSVPRQTFKLADV